MFLSKSFGYAMRGVLFLAMDANRSRKIQAEEIASALAIPRHFLAKIMKKMAEEGIVDSTKGPYGGFSINHRTLRTKLIDIFRITDGKYQFNECVLGFRKCNQDRPCPLHAHMVKLRNDMLKNFTTTSIRDIAGSKDDNFIRSIAAR